MMMVHHAEEFIDGDWWCFEMDHYWPSSSHMDGFSNMMLTTIAEEYVDGDGLTELKCTILTHFFSTVAFQMPP